MKPKVIFFAMAFALLAVLMMFCGENNKITGNGSQTPNGNVAAMLSNPGGTPAAHATVRFFPVNYNPRTGGLGKILAAVDSTLTNANGNYTANLDTGAYNILAAGDSGVVYQDSIRVTKDSAINPPTDTLKTPGSLRGVIRLQPGDDARKVFIIAMGTNSLTEPLDSVGNFALSSMAQGRYSVRILSVLDNYGVLDTSLAIRAGKNDTLGDTIDLPFTGIPVPSGLKIGYDTLKQIVTLTWNKSTAGRTVRGYNVYRRNVDSNTTIAAINLHLVADTVYSDSTGSQDQTYEYSVAVMDTNNTEGVKSTTMQICLSIKDFRIDSIGIKGTGVGHLNRPQSAASNKSYYVIIDWQDPFPSGARANIFDLQGNHIRTFSVRQDTSSDNLIGIKCAIDSMNTIYAVARDTTYTFDILGNVLVKYPVAIREILYSTDAIIKTGSTPQITAVRGNLVMVRNLMNGDTVSQFSIDGGSYGSLSTLLSIDRNGNYFLGTSINSYCFLKCGPAGTVLATWDSTFSKYMKFNAPQGIATDSAGRFYIDDAGNSRIMIFSNTGEYLGQYETFLNTQKWQRTSYNMAIDRALFLNANNDLCLLEGDVFSKIYVYHVPVK
jgi:hypothetical protein